MNRVVVSTTRYKRQNARYFAPHPCRQTPPGVCLYPWDHKVEYHFLRIDQTRACIENIGDPTSPV